MCFFFVPCKVFAVGAEQRGHEEVAGPLGPGHGEVPGPRSSGSLSVLHVHHTAPLMSKLKKLKKTFWTHEPQTKAHNLLVKTIEEKKGLFWKDESTLAFPLVSFSQYRWFFVASLCVLPFCYKTRLKMTKRSSCWVKSFCTVRGRGDTSVRRHFYSTVHSAFFSVSVNHLLYSLACPCPRREWMKKIKLLQSHPHVL